MGRDAPPDPKFTFTYDGPFLFDVDKAMYEHTVKTAYCSIRAMFEVQYVPDRISVKYTGKNASRGSGQTNYGATTNREINTVTYQVFVDPSDTTGLFNEFQHTIAHEFFHLFLPFVAKNACWSEGVTDFYAFYFRNCLYSIKDVAAKVIAVKKSDPTFYRHKHGYITGSTDMLRMYMKAPTRLDATLKKVMQDTNATKAAATKVYTQSDILSFDPAFEVFFRKDIGHIEHVIKV